MFPARDALSQSSRAIVRIANWLDAGEGCDHRLSQAIELRASVAGQVRGRSFRRPGFMPLVKEGVPHVLAGLDLIAEKKPGEGRIYPGCPRFFIDAREQGGLTGFVRDRFVASPLPAGYGFGECEPLGTEGDDVRERRMVSIGQSRGRKHR